MSFKCGIVGLPNVGKSTLFNALTSSSKAQAANFPFCTIDPNVGVVTVPWKIKAKFGGSSAGHNGIASIDKFIGKDYSRVRIGIGKPKENIEVGDFVLQNFDEDEMLNIEKISNDINNSISILVEKKLDLFSSTVNNTK